MSEETPFKRLPPTVVEVAPHVYFGSQKAVSTMVSEWGVRRLVRCVEDPPSCDETFGGDITVMHLPLADTLDQEILSAIAPAAEAIDDIVQSNAEKLEAKQAYEEALREQAAAQAPDVVRVEEETESSPAATPATATTEPTSNKLELDPQRLAAVTPISVYIFCQAGASRSAAVACGYLMMKRSMSLEEALATLGPRAKPNPSFIRQLMELDALQSPDGKSNFNLRDHMVDQLCDMFPKASENDVKLAYDHCQGDILQVRELLMRKFASALTDRHKLMIDSLLTILQTERPYLTRLHVEHVYNSCGKQRDNALIKLMKMTQEELEQLPVTTNS